MGNRGILEKEKMEMNNENYDIIWLDKEEMSEYMKSVFGEITDQNGSPAYWRSIANRIGEHLWSLYSEAYPTGFDP